MLAFNKFAAIAIFVILFSSCGSQGVDNIPTYTVSKGVFSNILTVEGIVEPVRTTSVISLNPDMDGMIEWLVEDGTMVEEGDLLCIIEDQAVRNEYEEMSLRLENLQIGYEKAKANLQMQYALLEARVKSNEAQAQISALDSLQLMYSTPNQKKVTELQLESALISKEKDQKKLDALEGINQSELRKLELEMQRVANRVQRARDNVDKLTIRSPRKGMAIRANSWTRGEKLQEGDNVWRAHPIITLPEMDKMKVKLSVTENDFKQINVGDSVKYSFDAMPLNTAYGKIVSKASMGQPIKRGSKVKIFEIQASMDSVGIMPEPGLTTNSHVIIKEISDVVLIPQVALHIEDSIKIVYVKNPKGRGFEKREVRTGMSSAREVIIEAGLEPGEIIALIKPEEKLIKGETKLPVADSTGVNDEKLPVDSLKKGTAAPQRANQANQAKQQEK